MTLYRQLLAAVILLFLLLYTVTVLSLVRTNVELIEQQMHAHVQDTANSLALSMSRAAFGGELAILETLFNAVADRGHFSRLEFIDLQGNRVLQREFPVRDQGAPAWFTELLPLTSPQAIAEVNSGWTRLGHVVVHTYPGMAYETLWKLIVRQLTWFLLMASIVLASSALALRVLLRPLRQVELQADEICQQQFPVQKSLPRTRELARVVEAMNRVSQRLRELFDGQIARITRLQEIGFRDPVTGLSNRVDFDARMQALADEEEQGGGALMITSVTDFARVNERAGRREGNAVLAELADRLKPLVERYPGMLLARRQGADFTLFVPGIDAEEARDLASEVLTMSSGLSWAQQTEDPLEVHLGLTHQELVNDPVQLLEEADVALRRARLEPLAGWQEYADDTSARCTRRTAEEWRELFTACLEQRRVVLAFQPMLRKDRSAAGHEAYARLLVDEECLTPSSFLAAAERLGYIAAIDRAMLEALPNALNEEQGLVAVNISGHSASDPEFRAWLPGFFSQHAALAKRLVIEIPEYHLTHHGDAIAQLQASIGPTGAGLAIDHFGRGSLATKYLYSLPLLYMKLHRSLVRNIERNDDQQAYVHALVQMARARDIQLFAEGIESAGEFEALGSLGVVVMSGYYLGRPVPGRSVEPSSVSPGL